MAEMRIDTVEAALATKHTVRYIQYLCKIGRLKAEKKSTVWLIDPKSLREYLKEIAAPMVKTCKECGRDI